jgi:hypothetical protein
VIEQQEKNEQDDGRDHRPQLTFSEELPEGCPCASAVDCEGLVYVVVPSGPLMSAYFRSQAERGRLANATGDAACARHGLSVFPSVKSCSHQRRLFPRLGNHIAVAMLDAGHGKIAASPSSNNPDHRTWWPYQHVIRHELFAVVEEE